MTSSTVSFRREAPGAVTVTCADGESLTYACDPRGHRITVSDRAGIRVVYGERGSRPGEFDTPLDLVPVTPEFLGEVLPIDAADAVWLAVADYGNRRVQIIDLDGAVIGVAADEGELGEPVAPCRLEWRAPILDIEGVDGSRACIHLGAALLFDACRESHDEAGAAAVSHDRAWRVC